MHISCPETLNTVGSCESALIGLQYKLQVGCPENPLNIWPPQPFPPHLLPLPTTL